VRSWVRKAAGANSSTTAGNQLDVAEFERLRRIRQSEWRYSKRIPGGQVGIIRKMIELDFTIAPDAKGPGSEDPKMWVTEILLSSFEGFQVFIVNGVDFSSWLAILGFARSIRAIANRMARKVIIEEAYLDLTSEWIINFRLDGDIVEVSDQRFSVSVPVEELKEAAQRYADRVYAVCYPMSPEIIDSKNVAMWWNDDVRRPC